ncbi:Uncharacterised protein [Collinsella intestinalis]|nr:Uncharacterised protein [Collinsella intestinalis]
MLYNVKSDILPRAESTRTHSSAALAHRPATTSYCSSSSLGLSIISLNAVVPVIMVPAIAALDAPPVMAVVIALGDRRTGPSEVSDRYTSGVMP